MMESPMAKKIMLVEDDPTMRSVLKTLLEIEGFKVAFVPEFRHEEQVLETIQNESPDVVLMDVHMHQVNGIKVLKLIRMDQELMAVKVLMASGMDMYDQCMDAGANGFLLKPYMPDDLIDMIRSNL